MINFNPESYRILVVDDSPNFLSGVKETLDQAGFQSVTAESGENALVIIKKTGIPHLALVDINMPPGMDGFEFCEEVHNFTDMPIIMLTGIGEEETIVQAIEQYAEDYITKPFDPDVLLARIRRVLQRLGDFACPIGPDGKVDQYLSVSFPENQITLNDECIPLTPTETKLLYILMRTAGQIVPIDFILRRLWPTEAPNETRLRVYVHRLRQKLDMEQPKHNYIMSQRGKGYGFNIDANNNPVKDMIENVLLRK